MWYVRKQDCERGKQRYGMSWLRVCRSSGLCQVRRLEVLKLAGTVAFGSLFEERILFKNLLPVKSKEKWVERAEEF